MNFKKVKNKIEFVIFLLSFIFIQLVCANDIIRTMDSKIPSTAPAIFPVVDIVFPKDANVIEYARRLVDAGVLKNPWCFIYKSFFSPRIVPGKYRLQLNLSLDELFRMISKKNILKIRIPEGLTVHEISRYLHKQTFLKGTIFVMPKEGGLLPATYTVHFEERIENVVRRMEKAMEESVSFLWENKPSQNIFSLTKEQWITLASIVEKETGVVGERARIAGVFLNRLKINMPLQADPTIIYALTMGKLPLGRKLNREDTKIKSPYNTYYVKGLPPFPIACPGKAALASVLSPIESKDLYFVADGSGGHRFAATLIDHNKNVQLWKQGLKLSKN